MQPKLKSTLFSIALALIVIACSAPAAAHQTSGRHNKTQNGQGCSLSHTHAPTCLSNGKCVNGATCPSSNSVCESAFGFSSSDRTYSWTNRWNCHGRTFDNRGSWTGSATQFISCDYGYSPATPQDGDAILWGGGSVHSATIIGLWNGLSTQISSKYGCCGEYRHALSEAVGVYGSGWSVITLTSGSPIFKSLGVGDRVLPKDPADLEAITKEMPWYPSVLASAVVHEIEKARIIRQAGDLREDSRKKLLTAESPFDQLEILAADLENEEHFLPLAAYNNPEDSTEFIAGVEAGKILVEMATTYPDELNGPVAVLLERSALSEKVADGARAASIYFLSQILDTHSKESLSRELRLSASSADKTEGQINLVDYYRQEYLD